MKIFNLTIFILFFWIAPLSGLTMDEAIELAMKNNHRIKEQEHLSREQQQRTYLQRVPFLPKLNIDYSLTRRDNGFSFQTKSASTMTAEITYNLFNSFKDIKILKAFRYSHTASLYQKKAVAADIALEVRKAYIRFLKTRKGLEVAAEAVTLLKRQKRDAELFYREGIIAKNELLKVETELASAEQELLQSESELRIAGKELERIIGVSISQEEMIEEIVWPGPEKFNQKILYKKALQRRSELKYLEALRMSKTYTRDAARGAYLPSIDIIMSHNRYGDSVLANGRRGLHDSETRGEIAVTWTIFEGFRRRHKAGLEKSAMMAIEERIKDTGEEISLQLKTAIERYNVSLRRLEAAKKGIEYADENYRVTENRVRQQAATIADQLDARFLLTRARNEYNNVLYDLHLSLAEIERVMEGGVNKKRN